MTENREHSTFLNIQPSQQLPASLKIKMCRNHYSLNSRPARPSHLRVKNRGHSTFLTIQPASRPSCPVLSFVKRLRSEASSGAQERRSSLAESSNRFTRDKMNSSSRSKLVRIDGLSRGGCLPYLGDRLARPARQVYRAKGPSSARSRFRCLRAGSRH